MDRLIAVVGATASGKSALALRLAQEFGGEIINADSRQFYRGMDIGTAKPTRHELELVPHHLVDFLAPTESFSIAEFLDMARSLVREINERDRLPLLVGGTGQYFWGLLEGWEVPIVPPDPEVRARLEAELARAGIGPLVQRLQEVDPEAARRTDPQNPRRVIRALERALSATGGGVRPRKAASPPYLSLVIGLQVARAELHARIRERVDSMIALGWGEEVEELLSAGVPENAPSMSAIGYREMARHIRGELTIVQVRHEAVVATNRLVRHQNNWFKPGDPRIAWIEVTRTDSFRAAKGVVDAWLRGAGSSMADQSIQS